MERGKKTILNIILLLVIIVVFLFVFNFGVSVFAGKQVFSIPVQGFGVSDKLVSSGQKFTLNAGSQLVVNIGSVQRKLTLKNINNKMYVGVDGVDVAVSQGKSNVFKLKDGRNLELKVESISKNNAVVVVKDLSVKKLQTVTPVVSELGVVPATSVKQTKPSFFSPILDKLGIKKSIIPKQDILMPQIDVKQVKKLEVKKLTYPLYDFKLSGKAMSNEDIKNIISILASRNMLSLLPASEYGLLVLLGMCSNGELDYETYESDVDCGGRCNPCDVGKKCNSGMDCISESCQYQQDRGAKVCIGKPVLCEDTSRGVILEGRDIVINKCEGRTLIKYQCYGPNIKTYRETRQVCPEGTFCSNGEECVQEQVSQETPGSEGTLSCVDNDIGNNKYNIGVVSDSSDRVIGKDRCANERELEQADCSEAGVVYNRPEGCGEGETCNNGACVAWEVCSEPNPGESRPGSTVFETRSGSGVRRHIDECASQTRIRHIICDGYVPRVSETDCDLGMTCNNGLCGQGEHHCLDFDWGAVDSENNVYWDGCSNPRVVTRANCIDDNIVDYYPELCSEGVCLGGRCVKPQCTDSDGDDANQEGHIFGTIIDSSTNLPAWFDLYDECRMWVGTDDSPPANDMVLERLCDRFNRPANRLISCESDQYCEDGRCVAGERTFVCHDTDNGENVLERGVVTTDRRPLDSWEDWCVGTDKVLEFFCVGDGYISDRSIQCPQYNPNDIANSYPHCYVGRCVKAIDSDVGKPDEPNFVSGDIFYRGSLTDIHGVVHPDFCRGGKVVELSADENGEIVEHEVECPEGYTCKETNPGVCSLI